MKVFANIERASRDSDAVPASYRVEFTLLHGTRRSGHLMLVPTGYSNHSMLMFRLKSLLVVELEALYPAESFHSSDVLGLG